MGKPKVIILSGFLGSGKTTVLVRMVERLREREGADFEIAIVENEIRSIPARYPNVSIEKYVIMPDHIHMIVMIHAGTGGSRPSPTIMDMVRVIKSKSAHRSGAPLWQRSYHEHVIRNEQDYLEIWNYIDTNPAKWAEDRYDQA